MTNYFETNINALNEIKGPRITESDIAKVQEAAKSEAKGMSIEECKNSSLTIKFSGEDSASVYVHSKYDPEKEAARLAESAVEEKRRSSHAVLGIGGAYLIRELLKLIDEDSSLLAYEHSFESFAFALKHFDMTDIINDKRVYFFIGETELDDIENFIVRQNYRSVQITALRAYMKLFPDEIENVRTKIFSTVEKKNINLNTIFRFDKIWAYNIMSNIRYIPFVYGINSFFGKFDSKPVAVVSAGPSLDKNIETLKANKDKLIIIAVDTALKPLHAHGIEPHFAVAIDPQPKNAKYFRGINTKNTILIAESSIDNAILRNYQGPVYIIDSIFPLASYLMQFLGERGEVVMGGSVSTTAYEFARLMGADPIILLGLDLSYPKLNTHIRGSYHEEDFFTQISKLDTFESRIYELLNAGSLTPTEDINGERVFMDSRFSMYKSWYEQRIEKTDALVINASEGGVHLNGASHAKLSEICENYSKLKLDFKPYFKNFRVDKKEEGRIRELIEIGLKKIEEELALLENAARRGADAVRRAKLKHERRQDSSKELNELSKVDAEIAGYEEAKYLIGITMQKAIAEIKEHEREGKEMDGLTSSKYLYDELIESCDFNKHLINMGLAKIGGLPQSLFDMTKEAIFPG